MRFLTRNKCCQIYYSLSVKSCFSFVCGHVELGSSQSGFMKPLCCYFEAYINAFSSPTRERTRLISFVLYSNVPLDNIRLCLYLLHVSMVCLQNKKQRMMVRHAVLKGKDPSKLLEEMEIIDKIGRFYCDE